MNRTFDFIANSGDGVFAVDRRQSIVLWNDRATGILGFTPDEVLGRKCYEVIRGRDSEDCSVCRPGCSAMKSARKLRPLGATELTARTRGQHDAWLNLSTVLVPSSNGGLEVLVHLFREVTQDHDLLSAAREFAATVSGRGDARPTARSRERTRQTSVVELTHREHEVLTALAAGTSTDGIAAKLGISQRTVRNHVSNILSKLDVHSRLEAVTYSIKNGLL